MGASLAKFMGPNEKCITEQKDKQTKKENVRMGTYKREVRKRDKRRLTVNPVPQATTHE